MRIRSIQVARELFALTRPYAIAGQAPMTDVENVVVRIETEDGEIGFGAASPGEHVTGETVESCRAALAPGERSSGCGAATSGPSAPSAASRPIASR